MSLHLMAAGEDQMSAAISQPFGRGAADAVVGSGDEDGFFFHRLTCGGFSAAAWSLLMGNTLWGG